MQLTLRTVIVVIDSSHNYTNIRMENTTNPLYQLLDKQATEFELFGQRLKSEIQNSYQEFIKLQQQQQKSRHEITQDEPYSQSELIDSLKARIEELETDSIIKNQNIEKQKIEIQQLKQELNKYKNVSGEEFKIMKQEIEELNDFKNNFMLLFDSFEQIKSDVDVLKSKFQDSDRLLAEELQFSSLSSSPFAYSNNGHNQSTSGLKPKENNNKRKIADEEFNKFINSPFIPGYEDAISSDDEDGMEDLSDTPGTNSTKSMFHRFR